MVVVVEEIKSSIGSGKHEFVVHCLELFGAGQESGFRDRECNVITGSWTFHGCLNEREPGSAEPDKRFIVRHQGDVMVDLPIKELGDQAPEYKRPFVNAAKPAAIDADDVKPPMGVADALRKLIGAERMKNIQFLMDLEGSQDAGDVEAAGPNPSPDAPE